MRLLYNFIKDMKISFKSFYIYLEIIMALIFVAILLFVVPENFSSSNTIFTHVDIPGNSSNVIDDINQEQGKDSIILVDSFDEMMFKLEEDRSAIGLNITSSENKLVYEFVLQGYENQKVRNIMEKSLVSNLTSQLPSYKNTTEIITIDGGAEKLSDRLNMLPIFLGINSSLMGLFIIAAYIFMDKDEGSIKAFVVTPARVWEYLLSKVGVMLVMGLITGLISTIALAGFQAHYLHLILLLIAANFLGSCLGLFIASFYDTIIKAMGTMYMVVIVLTFSTISYYMPTFSPVIIKVLPSYPMLFSFREILLSQPNLGYIYKNVVFFIVLGVALFLFANKRYKKTLFV